MRQPLALWATAASLCLSCGVAVTEPEPEPEFGTLRVSISTGGNTPDENGYRLTVVGRESMMVGLNTTVTIADLSAGSHVVRLEGLAPQCIVGVGYVRSVQIHPDSTTQLDFAVVCSVDDCGFYDYYCLRIGSFVNRVATAPAPHFQLRAALRNATISVP